MGLQENKGQLIEKGVGGAGNSYNVGTGNYNNSHGNNTVINNQYQQQTQQQRNSII